MKYFSKCLLIYSLVFSMVNLSITSTGIQFMSDAMAQNTQGLPSISEKHQQQLDEIDRVRAANGLPSMDEELKRHKHKQAIEDIKNNPDLSEEQKKRMIVAAMAAEAARQARVAQQNSNPSGSAQFQTQGLPGISESHQQQLDEIDRVRAANGLPSISSAQDRMLQQQQQQQDAQQQASIQSQQAAEQQANQDKVNQALNSGSSKDLKGAGDRIQTAEWLSLLNMLAIALIASSLYQYKWTMDMGVVIAGGVAFIAGEIYAIMKYKSFNKKQVEKVLSYTEKADGSVDDSQIEMFEEQREAYENAKKTAQTKSMLQTAAAVAFAAGALLALTQETLKVVDYSVCVTTLTTAATSGKTACPAWCAAQGAATLGMSVAACKAGCVTCVAQIAALAKTLAAIEAMYNAPGMSKEKHPKLTAMLATFDAQEKPACLVGTEAVLAIGATIKSSTCTTYSSITMHPKLSIGSGMMVAENQKPDFFKGKALEGSPLLKIAKHISPIKLRDLAIDTGTFELEDKEVGRVLEDSGFRRFASVQESIYDMSSNNDFQSEGEELRTYLSYHESQRLSNGETSSISLDHYNEFVKAFSPKENPEFEFELKETLKYALNKGVDLIFPKAEAYLTQGLGLSAVAIGVLLGVTQTSFQMVDLWLAVPGHRSLVFAGMAATATASVVLTRGIIKQMEQNIKKIDEVIKKMRRIRTGSQLTQGIAGTTGQITSTNSSFQAIDNDVPIAAEGEKFECVTRAKNGKCVSLKRKIEKSAGFTNLGESAATAATLSGSLADGISGRSRLSSGTLDTAGQLGGLQNAIKKRLNRQKVRLNKLRKRVGKKPINFDRAERNIQKRIQNAIKRGLKKKNFTASGLLSNSNIVAPSAILNGEEKKKVAGADVAAALKDFKLGAFPALPTANFKLEPMEDDELLGLTDESMDANADAVAALDVNQESGDDITEDPNKSIWNVISVRYMKSGLARLLGKDSAKN